MNSLAECIFPWPQMPPLPPVGRPVLIRLTTAAPRQQARQELRNVLRQVLATWSNQTPDSIPLRETPRGPLWDGELAGHSLTISLSYCDNEAWLGLLRGGLIGLDALSATNFTEVEIVSRLYLGPAVWQSIQQSTTPTRAFALAWTALEARLKCFKQPLTEWPANQNRVHPDTAPEKPPGAGGARVCDPQRVASQTNVGISFGVTLPAVCCGSQSRAPGSVPECAHQTPPLEMRQYFDNYSVVTVAIAAD